MTDLTDARRQSVRVAPMQMSDAPALAGLLKRIPHGEYTFLKAGSVDLDPADLLARPGEARLLIARADDHAVGVLALIPGAGWSSHVGEMRLVVDPAERGHGVGRLLAANGVRLAIESGLSKVTVEVLADQASVVDLFRGLGFVAEGLLTDRVRDDTGSMHDLLVLGFPVHDTWALLETIGAEQGLDNQTVHSSEE